MQGSGNLGIEIIHFKTTDSTNLRAKELLKGGERVAPFCIIADKQTGGYGQARRPYYCPIGGLYMSLVLPEKEFQYKFSAGFAAVCVANVVSRIVTDGRKITIKWVNDINLDDKKIGGVLIEKVGASFIIGIGLNLLQTEPVPTELEDRMGFIYDDGNITITLHEFAEKIIHELASKKLTDEETLAEYKRYCKIEGLNIDGSLTIVDANGEIVKKFDNLH